MLAPGSLASWLHGVFRSSTPPADRELIQGDDDWGPQARESLERMPTTEREAWLQLLLHASTAGAAKPSASWLKQARRCIEAVGEARFRATVAAWLGFLQAPTRGTTRIVAGGAAWPPEHPSALIQEGNGRLLKGLAWSCASFDDAEIARALADAAGVCFKKIPNVGPRCKKAGNACLHALGAMPGRHGVVQLQRLKERIVYPSTQQILGPILDAAAARAGISRDELEDLAVPTYELQDGRLRTELGGYVAEIAIDIVGPRVRWARDDGTPLKAEPRDLKLTHPDELKAFKATLRDMEQTLTAQRRRIERLMSSERTWSVEEWRARYLDHPLLSTYARRLIWSFTAGERAELGAWRDGQLVDLDDRPLDWLTSNARVRLWHPIASPMADVLAWRLWLERHAVTQPFKQAHREIYVLTDAEQRTDTYSNRFAAHILRQHQLQALCQQRGWVYRLQGAFDGANSPTLDLPGWGLSVEFWVDGVANDELSNAGIYLYVTTDQVRFRRLRGYEAVRVADVPTLAFSEAMRDVDLFVGVCSVGNDPNWRDGQGWRDRDYWQDYAFGALSASATTRREVLERLVPRLKIGPRCSLEERFLVVRGNLRTYRIHLGSGNILMEPNSQYLCIVPGRGKDTSDTANVYLPFEGDSTLALILSKASLLANDSSIADPTILRQIQAAPSTH